MGGASAASCHASRSRRARSSGVSARAVLRNWANTVLGHDWTRGRRMRGCVSGAAPRSGAPSTQLRRSGANRAALPSAARRTRPCRTVCARAASAGAAAAAQQTCRNCRRPFLASDNGPTACVWHPQLYTGGELGKYTGFVPESPAFEHRMKVREDGCARLAEQAAADYRAPAEAGNGALLGLLRRDRRGGAGLHARTTQVI